MYIAVVEWNINMRGRIESNRNTQQSLREISRSLPGEVIQKPKDENMLIRQNEEKEHPRKTKQSVEGKREKE